MKKNISNNNLTEIDLAQKVINLPSTQNEALAEIVRGLYQGKPLLGKGGLLTNLVKDLTQIALAISQLDIYFPDRLKFGR